MSLHLLDLYIKTRILTIEDMEDGTALIGLLGMLFIRDIRIKTLKRLLKRKKLKLKNALMILKHIPIVIMMKKSILIGSGLIGKLGRNKNLTKKEFVLNVDSVLGRLKRKR